MTETTFYVRGCHHPRDLEVDLASGIPEFKTAEDLAVDFRRRGYAVAFVVGVGAPVPELPNRVERRRGSRRR